MAIACGVSVMRLVRCRFVFFAVLHILFSSLFKAALAAFFIEFFPIFWNLCLGHNHREWYNAYIQCAKRAARNAVRKRRRALPGGAAGVWGQRPHLMEVIYAGYF